MRNINPYIRRYLVEHSETINRLYEDTTQREYIEESAQLLINTFRTGHQLLICGNGGSAADSQHFAAELVPMGLPVIALTTDTSILTSIGNDADFSKIFSTQIKAHGVSGDVFIGISTSGKSVNVRLAFAQAHLMGLSTIALTGQAGIIGTSAHPTVTIAVPSTNTQHIQEAHITIIHILWQLIKEAL